LRKVDFDKTIDHAKKTCFVLQRLMMRISIEKESSLSYWTFAVLCGRYDHICFPYASLFLCLLLLHTRLVTKITSIFVLLLELITGLHYIMGLAK